ncbi:type II secretion system inner membrane protein GspF [bacterium]|nr:type II secretion system inner membrane protein GspF [bacterium]
MATFVYRAADRGGTIQEGVLEAKDLAGALHRLREMNFLPLDVNPKQSAGLSTEYSFKSYFQRIKSSDIKDFTLQLATLIDAGIPLDKSLFILEEMCEKEKLKELIGTVRKNVHSGATFADSLARNPRYFTRLYINMVKSGETGGVLDKILLRLADFLESAEELKGYIVQAMMYPLLLMVVGAIAVTLLLTFVLPKFTRIFEDMGTTLPLPTQVLLLFSNFIKDYWYFILLTIGIVIFSIRSYLAKEEGRYKWDSFKLRIPLWGDLIRKLEISRFARTFGTLINSGVPILQALAIVKDTLTNRRISLSLVEVYGGIKEGSGVAQPLKTSNVFPPMAIHMIIVGEETGNLEAMLLKIADTYEKEVKSTVKKMMSLIEPALILLMGLFIGFIVISMLLAIFSVNEIPF